MAEVLLANLFFIITGSAVLVVTAFVCIVCYHAIKIERTMRRILHRVETGAEVFLDDARAFRDHIANGGFFGKIVSVVMHAVTKGKRDRSSSRKMKDINNEE